MEIKRKHLIFVGIIIFASIMFLECKGLSLVEAFAQSEKEKADRIEKAIYEEETETVYIIVDILKYVYDADSNSTTELYCKMPNGDLEVFTITEAPEGKCKVACLVTKDINDYTTYKVVAVR